MRPSVSYSARIELDDTTIVSVQSIQYPAYTSHEVSWSAVKHLVRREPDGTIEYIDAECSFSPHTYPCHIDAIEAGVAHFLRAASVDRAKSSQALTKDRYYPDAESYWSDLSKDIDAGR